MLIVINNSDIFEKIQQFPKKICIFTSLHFEIIKEQRVKFERINFNAYENQNDGFWHMTILIPIYSSQLKIYVHGIETGH